MIYSEDKFENLMDKDIMDRDVCQYKLIDQGDGMINGEDKSESLMDKDICQYEPIDQPHIHEQIPLLSCIDEDQPSESYNGTLDSATCDELVADEDQGTFVTNSSFYFIAASSYSMLHSRPALLCGVFSIFWDILM